MLVWLTVEIITDAVKCQINSLCMQTGEILVLHD